MKPVQTGRGQPEGKPLKRPGEVFDINSAVLEGRIVKLWPRGGDVFARLGVFTSRGEGESAGVQAAFCSLRFPQGKAGEEPLTLQAGDAVRVSGYLTHNEYFETIHRFLQDAREPNFLKGVPPGDLVAWQAVTFRRVNLILNVRAMSGPGKEGPEPRAAQVILEGIVARRWQYAAHLFIRLAVYDRFTPLERGGASGKHGRPRRKPHYITVCFPDGTVPGRERVSIQLKERIRITGEIRNQHLQESLHQALLETGSPAVIELLSRLPNADRCSEITAVQESVYIEAASIITYTAN